MFIEGDKVNPCAPEERNVYSRANLLCLGRVDILQQL